MIELEVSVLPLFFSSFSFLFNSLANGKSRMARYYFRCFNREHISLCNPGYEQNQSSFFIILDYLGGFNKMKFTKNVQT